MNLAELVLKVDEPCWVGDKQHSVTHSMITLKVDEPCWVGVKGRWTLLSWW